MQFSSFHVSVTYRFGYLQTAGKALVAAACMLSVISVDAHVLILHTYLEHRVLRIELIYVEHLKKYSCCFVK